MTAFRRNCELLRKFSDCFWSAHVVAELGERVIKEMERASTTLTKEASPSADDPAEELPHVPNHSDGQWRAKDAPAFVDPTAIDVAVGMDNMVDFSAVDAISGQDVFGHIDPNFNLTAIEDVLEANLDIGLPLNWGDWGHFTT